MSTDERGSESERLAPVTPLFGGAEETSSSMPRSSSVSHERPTTRARSSVTPDARWHSSWIDDGATDAPGASRAGGARSASSVAGRPSASLPPDAGGAERRDDAERMLLRRLRGRSLSVGESHALLIEHGLTDDDAHALLEIFAGRGYLDDGVLAEQLVRIGERKGQGRSAIALVLARRGVPRDVADVALDALADEETDRALGFARRKARSMGGADRDVAVRRLTGQLARRGYSGSVAASCARQAIDEVR